MANTTDRLIDAVDMVSGRYKPGSKGSGFVRRIFLPMLLIFLLVNLGLGWYWSQEPDLPADTPVAGIPAFVGQHTTSAIIKVVETLLNKPGGYLTNDVTPPSIFMDNIDNWEFGVLTQSRDLARAMRNDFSRSQSQSVENEDLAKADPLLSFSNDSWLLPATESEYREALKYLASYQQDLRDSQQGNAQFYSRADNLASWLAVVEKRLGSLSQRLSASTGQLRVNTDLAGAPDATQSAPQQEQIEVKTSWLEIDDVFYETRGTAWALVQFLRAAEYDFRDVLVKKNALVSLRQIIRELESTQQTLWSPMVLNGSGFGMFANHSLVMANYISRANAAVIDLRRLLEDG